MPAIMNEYNLFSQTKAAGFGDEAADFTSFLDSSYADQSLSLFALPAASFDAAPATAYANAFRTQDHLLDSPLGLSPFDYDYTSPMLGGSGLYSSEIDGLATPELADSQDLPSLFFGTQLEAAQSGGLSPVWNPVDAVVDEPLMADLAVSPEMMRLSSPAPSAAPSKKRKASTVSPVLEHEGREPVKDKFTGVRNTKIPPIPFTAPTMTRSYVIPSVTSRRKAPAAITAKITGAKRARKDKAPAPPADDEEGMDPDELPDELLSAIELKRRQNTLAARRSRMRKAGHIQGLQDEIDGLKGEVDEWKQKYEELQEVVRALRGGC